ncbi:unnamed protein product [Periconia digitata]|uniref:RNA-directed DNA polymerase n=1 Tax=Periconia digitata TaxID=1303443 RepID=A0A9W4XPQ0_9PLEO|nr:unnamed protein product [Periconia digitata]
MSAPSTRGRKARKNVDTSKNSAPSASQSQGPETIPTPAAPAADIPPSQSQTIPATSQASRPEPTDAPVAQPTFGLGRGPGRPGKPQNTIAKGLPGHDSDTEAIKIAKRGQRFGTDTDAAKDKFRVTSILKPPGAFQDSEPDNDEFETPRTQGHSKRGIPELSSIEFDTRPRNSLQPSARNLEYSPHTRLRHSQRETSSVSESDTDDDESDGRPEESDQFAEKVQYPKLPPPAIGDSRPRRSFAITNPNDEVTIALSPTTSITLTSSDQLLAAVSEDPQLWLDVISKHFNTSQLLDKDIDSFETEYKTLEEHYLYEKKRADHLVVERDLARNLRNDVWEDVDILKKKVQEASMKNVSYESELHVASKKMRKLENKCVRRSNRIENYKQDKEKLQQEVERLNRDKRHLSRAIDEWKDIAGRNTTADPVFFPDPESFDRHTSGRAPSRARTHARRSVGQRSASTRSDSTSSSSSRTSESEEDVRRDPPPPSRRERRTRHTSEAAADRVRAPPSDHGVPPGYTYDAQRGVIPLYPHLAGRDSTEHGMRPIGEDPYKRKIDKFSGRNDKFEPWQMAVKTALRAATHFSERQKIDFIRDLCTNDAFDNIVDRADPDSRHPERYLTADELWQDLNMLYNSKDKAREADVQLWQPSMHQGYKEPYSDFMSRLNAIARQARIDDATLMNHFKRLMRSDLLDRIAWLGHDFRSCREMNAHILKIEAESSIAQTFKQAKQSPFESRDRRRERAARSSNSSLPLTSPAHTQMQTPPSNQRTASSTTPERSDRQRTDFRQWELDLMNQYHRTPEQWRKLKQNKACAKCGSTSHKPNDANAPCAKLPVTPATQIAFLKSASITQTPLDPVYEEDEDSEYHTDDSENESLLPFHKLNARLASAILNHHREEQPLTVKFSAAVQESIEDGKQFTFKGKVKTPQRDIPVSNLVDTGATYEFVDRNFVRQHRLTTVPLAKTVFLELANGNRDTIITHMAEVKLSHGRHNSNLMCFVTDCPSYQVIVGLNWLQTHDPTLNFNPFSMTFSSGHCTMTCLRGGRPETISAKGPTTPDVDNEGHVRLVSAYVALRAARSDPDSVVWVFPHEFDREIPVVGADIKREPSEPGVTISPDPEPPPGFLSHADQELLVERLFAANPAAMTDEDFDKFFKKLHQEPRSLAEIRKRLPERLHKHIQVFNPKDAQILPKRRPGVDHSIELDGTGPPKRRVYGLSRMEMQVVKAYVDEMLGKGFIRPSSSPYAAPLLVVKKPGGGLRVCVDYRELNAKTVKDRNAPPVIKDTMARLAKTQFMTILDIIHAFNTIRIREGDEYKTAFLTRFGLFEYVVMPFGLCNAPATFQRYINDILHDILDDFCTAYIDDILIYSENEEDHDRHVDIVLSRLGKANLFLDIDKCQFSVKKVKYLGMIISTDGISMDPAKVSAILEWEQPRCVRDIQSFIGFANFYRRFITGFSHIVRPLIEIIKNGNKVTQFPLPQDSPAIIAFEELKKRFTEAPVLAHFDPDLPCWVETDASDYVIAAVLSQMHEDGLRPVAFLSQKMTPAECNYEIYDKELLAIVRAFEEWRPELVGTEDPVQVLSDHQALQYFMTDKKLNRRQARWSLFLAEFNFKITYRPGRLGSKPDSLTRRPGDLPGDNDERNKHQVQSLLKPHQVVDHTVTHTLHNHLDGGSHPALHYAKIINNEYAAPVTQLASLVYHLSETSPTPRPEPERRHSESHGNEGAHTAVTAVLATDVLAAATESMRRYSESLDDDEAGPVQTAAGPQQDSNEMDIHKEIKLAYNEDEIVQSIMDAKRRGDRRIPWHLIHREGIRIELKDCTLQDGMLYVKHRLYVPDARDVRTKLLHHVHASLPGGHAGKHGTFHKVFLHYYWPNITSSVSQFVKGCQTCKRSKAFRDGKHGLLHPLAIPDRYWSSISVDFITPLPECHRHGATYKHIMVVVDRLSKTKRFVPLTSIDVEDVVQAFIDYIWRQEGYPDEVISDRGSQFTSHFWKRLCQRLGTTPKLSTAFHPETDGQTENANGYLKQYLRAFCAYDQDNWVDLLATAEFEANMTESASTKLPPFLATKGYLPKTGFEPPTPIDNTSSYPTKREMKSADRLIDRITELKKYLHENLSWAQQRQKEYADQKRLPAPEFRVGDQVWVDARNMRTDRPSQGLSYKNVGPFEITKVHNNAAYELQLPPEMKMHPVFHPWLLHLHTDGLPNQQQDGPGPVRMNDQGADSPVYEVAAILDSRMDRAGQLHYKVLWQGYPNDPTWEPYKHLVGSEELLGRFHSRYKRKSGPASDWNDLPGATEIWVETSTKD